jgi:outer membrane protein assembly factor BamB
MGLARRVSRRSFVAAGAGLVTASHLLAIDEKANIPVISKKVEKVFKAPCKEPNDLAFVPEGLWILDQVDPNKALLVKPEDGTLIRTIQTESIHGSGIALYIGALWVTSTKTADGSPPKTMKVDPANGKTIKQWVTPGSGIWSKGPNATVSGAHGIKFVDGKYWMAVPASGKLYLMEPETGEIIRTIPAPGVRTHGIAWDNGFLWCVESNDRAIYKLDPKDGKMLAKIPLTRQDPAVHGMDIHDGTLWYCDADSGWVCKLV